MLFFFTNCYRKWFGGKYFFSFNRFLYTLSLHGLGLLNHENGKVSGEDEFVKWFIRNRHDINGVIFDVGANRGDYARLIRHHKSAAELFCFEPHPINFKILEELSFELNFIPVMQGMGDKAGRLIIYDYASRNGSQHASIYKDVIEEIHKSKSHGTEVEITTIDEFVARNKISGISLLKIDTEGNELNVLKGARSCLLNNLINIVHFEFNEMNVVSKTFFRDILNELKGFEIYRLLPDGMVKLGEYNAVFFEIFAFQNIVAINKNSIAAETTS
ncbi:MAG: methyltransferase FkbM family [Segetibacter sp.]|nr:methyltransferase FkbM family [Segetibacter sp.]